MPNAKLTDHLHLHFIVFIWGFTAILGKLITITALPLVWYRMGIATALIGLYLLFKGIGPKVTKRDFGLLIVGGVALAVHWVTFFMAIKTATVAVALTVMASGAFFTALIEPLWNKGKIIGYELLFGMAVLFGLAVIFGLEPQYVTGMLLALLSAFLAAVFSVINGRLVKTARPSVITFYELLIGVTLLSLYLGATNGFSKAFFDLPANDWSYIAILASICTAYAFIASVRVMRNLSAYTVMLTINLEPVYGIVLAYFILSDSERMSAPFYIGAGVIVLTVIANGWIKNRARLKRR